MSDFIKIKTAIDKFLVLNDSEWNDFSGKLIPKHFSKGDYLIKQGQVENYIYFLNKGATRNYFIKDGKDFTVDFQFTGDFVTAYYSLITREPSPIFIEVIEDTGVLAVSHKSLNEFYSKYHNGERIGRLMAEFQYAKRLQREMDLLSHTAEQRYAELMQKNPVLIQNISVKHLSSYLGIHPESLSRIRKLYAKS